VKRGLFLLPLALWACGGSSPQTVELRQAVAAAGEPAGPAVAFRMPARRGVPRLYELPGLREVETSLTTGPATDRIVGFASDDDLLYTVAGTDLEILDLRAGRTRTLDSGVTHAVMAPTGQVLVTRGEDSLDLAAERRVTPVSLPKELGTVEMVWPLSSGRLAVVARDSTRALLVISSGGTTTSRRTLPVGPITHSAWGDVAAVASPEGVIVVEVLRDDQPLRLRLDTDVGAMAFSASGHRLYVATVKPEILVFERFSGDALHRITLDTVATAVRTDRFGRYLFATLGTHMVVVTLADETVTPLAGTWDTDLPDAGPNGTILVRRGDDLVAVRPDTAQPLGTVRGAARDHWIIAPLDVRRPALQLARTDAGGGTGTTAGGGELFVQVSSTSNAQWAEGLAADLRTAGMAARVLSPTTPDEMYRVVLGPYATRDEAEEIGRKLGMPYWIFQRDTTATGTSPQ